MQHSGQWYTRQHDYDYKQLDGKWRMGEIDGNTECRVELSSTTFLGVYPAGTEPGCPAGVWGASMWRLRGDEIRLIAPGEQVKAELFPVGDDQSKAAHPRAWKSIWSGSDRFLAAWTRVR